ncbi:hypothetical protein [Nostoc sp. UHCC 0252]|nr:hypothetical protein [Nostoc sp. UHCC 0252]MEA5601183.1 hypothetical protein [Nostoc sp. UHCC 0252]
MHKQGGVIASITPVN